jgi:hypothetical protein
MLQPYYPRPHRHNQRSVSEDVSVGAHESGHALLRWFYCYSIGGITIELKMRDDGTIINEQVWADTDKANSVEVFNRIVVLAAGAAAEMV